jgi:hexosaminidase
MDKAAEPLAIGGFNPLDSVYNYNPTPDSLNANEQKFIMGAQANVWTEYLSEPEDITYMVLPRMAALSEVVWSPKEKRDWKKFYSKLPYQFEIYKAMGLRYSECVDNLYVRTIKDEAGKKLLQLESEIPDAVIRYTLNDSLPTSSSALFVKPMTADGIEKINAAAFVEGKQTGKLLKKSFTMK